MKENYLRQSGIYKIATDILIILSSYIISIILLDKPIHLNSTIILLVLLKIILDFMFGVHKKSWLLTNVENAYEILYTNLIIFGIYSSLKLVGVPIVEYNILILMLIQNIFYQAGIRLVYRETKFKFIRDRQRYNIQRKRTLVYGAGEAGEHIAREGYKNPNFLYNIIGYLDDDPKKQNYVVYGYKVLGNRTRLAQLIQQYKIQVLIIAIPTLKNNDVKEIYKIASSFGVEAKILPSFNDILENEKFSKQLKDVSVEDLLGRNVVKVNNESIKKFISNKIILITGGAGSIGSEMAKQVARYSPKLVIILDVNENQLYFLELELKRHYTDLKVISEICNIREIEKLDFIFEKYQPEVVIHAAAHKHVPLMEHNPEEAIKNNIFGTKNVIDAADKFGVDNFVLISTDKAVNPTNVMGATKRASELLILEKNKTSKTNYMAVRFGNVLGSNGSVIPLFKSLIKEGRNLTVTHPEVTRFFMTISEAAQLVLEAAYIGNGGEVFILDMGEPVKIYDLAQNLILMSGLVQGKDIDIDIVGLRPGEKLYEELLYDTKASRKTENEKIFIADIKDSCEINIDNHLEILKKGIEQKEYGDLKKLLQDFIVTYKCSEESGE